MNKLISEYSGRTNKKKYEPVLSSQNIVRVENQKRLYKRNKFEEYSQGRKIKKVYYMNKLNCEYCGRENKKSILDE